MLSILFLLPFLINSQLICPSQHITSGKGSIPSDASKFTVLPANFNCDYQFDVPSGFALSLRFYASYDSGTANITYVDNLGNSARIGANTNNLPQWAVQPNAHVIVKTTSATSKLLIYYEFVDISKYYRIRFPTGKVLSLATFQDQTYYTFYSQNMDSVVLNLAKSFNNYRVPSSNYYIFDGDNIVTAKMIGRLSDYLTTSINSTGSSISLVNFYGTRYSDFIISNDKKSIDSFAKYSFSVLANNPTYPQTDLTFVPGYSAATFYCVDCESLYLESLGFYPTGSVQLVPLAPTNKIDPVLTYNSNTFNNSTQLPQVIPNKLFTIIYNGKYIETHLGVKSDNWLKPSNGRQGFMFSPTVWKAGTQSVFSYFFDSDISYKFSLGFLQKIVDSNSNLEISIGTSSSTNIYTNSTALDYFSAVGTHMNVTFKGDYKSFLTLQFNTTLPN
ncbi:unnamed protein product [Caenorhabditis angaria]|uniref:CUB-like domain-containing protein n=1 Tax=Caenorhabditis angaria TaxID=860376 RepID=A0A9P1N621_9PELO|nr:unnamed protein product [Caenorhabditis angaria]